MLTSIERNFSLCFNKIKRLQSPPPPNRHRHRHRRHHSNPNLIKNFNTLYDIDSDVSITTGTTTKTDAAADFSSAVASNRFFFSSPGRSNSIIESSSSLSTSSLASTSSFSAVNGGFAIPTISPDPYFDFRKSMQEMVEARDDLNDARANWEYLHELLTCYLDLNPKSAHKFIVGAFADLLVTLMAADNGGCRRV